MFLVGNLVARVLVGFLVGFLAVVLVGFLVGFLTVVLIGFLVGFLPMLLVFIPLSFWVLCSNQYILKIDTYISIFMK